MSPTPAAWTTAAAATLRQEQKMTDPMTSAERPTQEVAPRTDGCIETTWPRDKRGYGMAMRGGIRWRAHRYAWVQAHGPIPEGLVVCHSCDNPPCVNVEHLWLGTHAQNIRDRDLKGRTATGDRNGSRTRPDRRPRGPSMRHPKLGEANGRAKVTAELVRMIRRRVAAGETKRALAVEVGLAESTVGRIVRGRYWSHV